VAIAGSVVSEGVSGTDSIISITALNGKGGEPANVGPITYAVTLIDGEGTVDTTKGAGATGTLTWNTSTSSFTSALVYFKYAIDLKVEITWSGTGYITEINSDVAVADF
jgi:hypothetical protein